MTRVVAVYTQDGTPLSDKKKEIMPFIVTWMDLEIVMPREVSQAEKDKYYHMISLVESKKKKKPNELIHKTETNSQMWKINLWLPTGKVGVGIN